MSEFRFLWFRNRKNRQPKVIVATGFEVNCGTDKASSFTQSKAREEYDVKKRVYN